MLKLVMVLGIGFLHGGCANDDPPPYQPLELHWVERLTEGVLEALAEAHRGQVALEMRLHLGLQQRQGDHLAIEFSFEAPDPRTRRVQGCPYLGLLSRCVSFGG